MRKLGSHRRLGVITATLMLAAGTSALTACSGSTVDLDWTAFGLETSLPDTSTTEPGDSTPGTDPDTTGVVVTTTEPEYSGEGAWLFITSSEVDPGANFSLQVVGFAPDTEATIELRTAVGTTVFDTVTTDDEGGLIRSYVLPRSTPEGDHRIVAIGTDPNGDDIEVGQRLTVDLGKPVIAGFSASPSVVAVGNTVSVFVNVTDTYGVETVSITTRAQTGTAATWCTGAATLVSGSDENGRWRVNCVVPGTAPKTGFLVTATATDFSENSATTASTSPVFNTANGADVSAPVVTSVNVSSGRVSAGDTITITSTVTDGIGVDAVKVTVRTPGDAPANWCDKYATRSSGTAADGTWQVSCTVPLAASAGVYSVQVVANDAAANFSPSGTRTTFEVAGITDSDPPSITNGSATPSSVAPGESFTVSVDITDATGVENVYISVTGVDVSCGPASNAGSPTNGTWTTTCTVGALVVSGTYSVEINADDLAGNITFSSTSVPFTVVVV